VPGTGADDANTSTSIADLAAAVSALQVQLVGVTARVREGEVENQSLRETIANLANENQLLKRRRCPTQSEPCAPRFPITSRCRPRLWGWDLYFAH
jgi:hypothetical protein